MIRARRLFAYSLIDQGAVSLGNFLTIALGAHWLPFAEQGKLVYLYTLYIALVLFNTAAFFSSANIVRNESGQDQAYKHLLGLSQIAVAVVGILLVWGILFVAEQAFGLRFTGTELLLMALFLLFQQLADFYRRAGYVFDHIGTSASSSVWLHGSRILGIVLLRPDTLSGYLLIMTAPALPVMGLMLMRYVRTFEVGTSSIIGSLYAAHMNLSKWGIYNAPLKWATLHLPVLIIGIAHSIEAAAIMGSIRALTTFANVLLELLETFVPAWLAAGATHGHMVLRRRSLRLLWLGAAIWMLGLLLIAVAGEIIVDFVLGSSYVQYSDLLYIIWISNGLYFAGRVVGVHYRTLKNAKLEFSGSLIGSLALMIALPLIWAYGAWGAAWCLVITQLAILTAMMASRKRYAVS